MAGAWRTCDIRAVLGGLNFRTLKLGVFYFSACPTLAVTGTYSTVLLHNLTGVHAPEHALFDVAVVAAGVDFAPIAVAASNFAHGT
jgi:hypothetical protein